MLARRILSVLAGIVCSIGIDAITLGIASSATNRKAWWIEMMGGWFSVTLGSILGGYLFRQHGWIAGVIVGIGVVAKTVVVLFAMGLVPSQLVFIMRDNPAIILDMGGTVILGAGGGTLGSHLYAKIARRGKPPHKD